MAFPGAMSVLVKTYDVSIMASRSQTLCARVPCELEWNGGARFPRTERDSLRQAQGGLSLLGMTGGAAPGMTRPKWVFQQPAIMQTSGAGG
ncbi:MAG: hypothetical protein DMG24_06185 [Acidobacteria bacterium]|nr:MAG: hypothetical protein DMG24_06185 [Acidobacteriota bacterium]